MKDVKITVIVPVFNSENFLKQCIESLLCQTYSHLEIVLVDDGSADGSEDICNGYCKLDSRLKYIKQENQGVSVARNTGISVATGDYICFLDSDDMLKENALQLAVEHIDDADVLFMGYEKIDKDDKLIDGCAMYPEVVWNQSETIDVLMEKSSYTYQGYVWSKLYRADIIKREKLQFAQGIYYNEDRLFNVSYMLHCTKTKIYTDAVYRYRIHESSVMSQTEIKDSAVLTRKLTEIVAFDKICDLLREQSPGNYPYACQLTFYMILTWLKKVPNDDKVNQAMVNKLLSKYCKACVTLPIGTISLTRRMKIMVHYLLKR